MLYAIIDIGSSIVKYKIYEYTDNIIEPVIIHDKTNGLISYRQEGILTDEGIDELTDTLNEFRMYSDKLHVDKSYYFATASLRNILNKEEVLSIIKEKLGIDITILTGEEEAIYSFNSINMLDIPRREGILVDIGGGSSEISIFKEENIIEEQKSIPMGVLSIYNRYVGLLYPTKDEQEIIIEEILKAIERLNVGYYDKKILYGIGKTCVTLKKLFEHMKIKQDKSDIITIRQVDKVLDKLSENTKENYRPALQVDSERVHTIIPSLLIIKALSIQFNIEEIYICNVTLQDGIIYTMLNKKTLQ